jgi:hypothetical protein
MMISTSVVSPFIDPNAFRNSKDYGKAHSRSVLNIRTIGGELKDQEGRKDRLVEKKVSYEKSRFVMETKAKGEHKQAIALAKRMIPARCTVILAAGPFDNEDRATVRERFEIECNKTVDQNFAREKSMLEGISLRLQSETAEVDKELGDVAAEAKNTEIKI